MIYNFGSLNIDYVYNVEEVVKIGETISSHDLCMHTGGKGLNQSIALSRAGVDVMHVGCVGKKGDYLIDVLKEAGVNTDFVSRVDGETGHAIIQLNRHSDNCILLHPGANYKMDILYIDNIFKNITSEDTVVLQNEILNTEYIAKRASEIGAKVVMNLSPITSEALDMNLNYIDYLFINIYEGKAITKLSDENEIGKFLTQKYPKMKVILTLGSRGSVYFHKNDVVFQKAKKTKIIDTTCAGDTFVGYFMGSIINGLKVSDALEISSIASSIAISCKGASNSIPDIKTVMTNFKKKGG